MIELEYHCPRSGRPLVRRGDAFESRDGFVSYRVTRGVPDFRQTPPSVSREEHELERMVAHAERDGWREAITAARPGLLRADFDVSKQASFLNFLPLSPTMRALEIGCGFGQVLTELAPRVRELYAVERSPGRAQFAAVRCRQSGCANVQVVAAGDDLLLPFANRTFDAVVMNHVLEWMPAAADGGVALTAQRRALREVRRVLAPGGVLYISTRNRYGMRLLLGGRDEHLRNIRFGSALPRRLARRLAAGRPGAFGLLHSYPTFERMLRASGFETLGSYWSVSDGRHPRRYVATDPASIRAARRSRGLLQGPTRGTRWLMPLVPARLVKYLAPGLTFVARVPRPGTDAQIAAE